ncbi:MULTISPECIES: enoyl-CoA hydratase/isomerase family protein [unclassified Actinopolyspora]|uniref:enoyl-CoA hydratase/isomerase family protein n=1 Tax=unclassified Actinopolyspora TaxID=2639451 RepID=UPI0013F660EB|nr:MULTISPECIES: enoyl-CoA hydratase/isomerase family protein [unclassified Actinopolyspora]NHD19525.1 enoyl-CoA hydratase/isomerase family protein [Actinopolyspora sp. BKK2]NHE78681.1 enoyl-CoA hydratase/isomerase family protein [Actinopolyspora sp. BKK1]
MSTELSVPGAPGVTVRDTGPVRELTIGTGSKRNALTSRDWDALAAAVRDGDRGGSTRAILIRGRGETFCAGSDMSEWVDADSAAVEDAFARMEAAFRAVEECALPVIAEIRGTAAGAGCQLALACDLRFLADSARMGMPIVRLGINPSPAFAARMLAVAGASTTRYLLYTGVLLDAPRAVACGLAEHHLPEGELAEFTARTLDRSTAQPPAALRAAKRAVSEALGPVREAAAGQEHAMITPGEFQHGIARVLGRPA